MSHALNLKFQEAVIRRDNKGHVSFFTASSDPQTPTKNKSSHKGSISERVASRILGMIKSGNLITGDKMPTEQQMCSAFGISRPALREALKALTVMGVLDSRQGGRYTVTDLSSKRLVEPFNMMLSMTDYNASEHFEARALVDLELVRFCGVRASFEHRKRLIELAEDGKAFYRDAVAFRLLDIEFHQAINLGADSPMLSTLSSCLYDVGLDLRRVASQMTGVIETSVEHHCIIAKAIMAKDTQAAMVAYRLYLEHIRDTTVTVKTKSKSKSSQ